MHPMQSAYQNLANAIVEQAVRDYRNALNGIGYGKYSPAEVIERLEKFFRSDYYELLTKVDAEYLIETLKAEHKENMKRINNEGNINSIDTTPTENNIENSIHLL